MGLSSSPRVLKLLPALRVYASFPWGIVEGHVFKQFCKSTATFSGFFPAATTATYGLIQGSEHTGFDKKFPNDYQKLLNLYNTLVHLLVEYFIWYIILSGVMGFIWALIVAEPRASSKSRYAEQRKFRGLGRP
jgi:hypothetical protein